MTTPAAPAPSSTAAPKGQRSRWRLSFSLRTLLVATTLAGVLLGRAVYFHRQREEAARYFEDRQAGIADFYHFGFGKAGLLNETAYLLTGNPQALRCATRDNLLTFASHGKGSQLGDEDVRWIRRFFPVDRGDKQVGAIDTSISAAESVLAEAEPIPVESLEFDVANPHWLRLFSPHSCSIWQRKTKTVVPELLPLLEAAPQLDELTIAADGPTLVAALASSPKLCGLLTHCMAYQPTPADLRRMVAQAPRLDFLSLSLGSLRDVTELGLLPARLRSLDISCGPLQHELPGGVGKALRQSLAQREVNLFALTIRAPVEGGLCDDDLRELLQIPRLERLIVDGRFTADGLSEVRVSETLQYVKLKPLSLDAAAKQKLAAAGLRADDELDEDGYHTLRNLSGATPSPPASTP